jgi:uracil phosphoribosyltransferase
MKQTFLTILRDKNTSGNDFRIAAEKLGYILANEAADYLEKKELNVETQLGNAKGTKLKNDIILVPILRSGIALLNPFLKFFENLGIEQRVGFVGLQRDEKTAIASLYYDKIPKINENSDVILLDPMIATGGSACDALKILVEKNIKEEKIIFAAVIAAEEGLKKVKTEFPKIKIIIPQVDKELNDKKFIVPGLGDFGDRYFGTED